MANAARTGAAPWPKKWWGQHYEGRSQQVLTGVPPWLWCVLQHGYGLDMKPPTEGGVEMAVAEAETPGGLWWKQLKAQKQDPPLILAEGHQQKQMGWKPTMQMPQGKDVEKAEPRMGGSPHQRARANQFTETILQLHPPEGKERQRISCPGREAEVRQSAPLPTEPTSQKKVGPSSVKGEDPSPGLLVTDRRQLLLE